MTRLPITLADFWPPVAARRAQPLRFDLRELSGSLGDLGTFLPLSVAMALTCGMDIGLIFIFAGLMNVITGIVFRQPIPVQPMKAIAAVAIAEGLSAGTIASAGMLGVLKVVAGLLLGGVLLITLRHYPTSILAVMVIVAGLTLARAAKDCLHGRALLIVATMIGVVVAVNTLAGFLVGCAVAATFSLLDRQRSADG